MLYTYSTAPPRNVKNVLQQSLLTRIAEIPKPT
jgi:hypothetical protein